MKVFRHSIAGLLTPNDVRAYKFIYSDGVFNIELMPDVGPSDFQNISEGDIRLFCEKHDIDYSQIAGELEDLKMPTNDLFEE